MVKAFGRRKELKPHVLADGGNRWFVRTQEMPVGCINALGRCIHAHAIRSIHLPVETDGDNRERILTERFLRDVDMFFDICGYNRAHMMATGVDETNDERLAPQRLQGKGLTFDIPECVVAYRLTECALADGQGGFSVVVLLCGYRRCDPRKGESAEYGGSMRYGPLPG